MVHSKYGIPFSARFTASILFCMAVAACSDDGKQTPADPVDANADSTPDTGQDLHEEPDTTPPEPDWLVPLRPLTTSNLRIVDDLGRDVLLRGVNITSLGEYWQGHPEQPSTLPTTDEDWDAMAATGLSVIRLVVHWSLIEPERGHFDEDYLDEIDGYVRAAAEHGIYTVIDMHQDAYTAFVFTPEDEACPDGTRPAKGWDGAPEWAVYTDDLSTCITGDRNSSPAIQAAWNHFYDNTDGIRDHFAASWDAVAARFAGRPEVAGYDVINEPEVPRASSQLTPLYEQMVVDVVTAIREAEADAEFQHLIFVEPAIPAGHPDYGPVIPDPRRAGIPNTNLVSAPHNYAETIGIPGMSMSFEAMNDLYLGFARTFGIPTWIGEYGFWSTSPETLEKLGRYALDEDRNLIGGAWWQWRQPCGDPHSIGPTGEYTVIHLNPLSCPGDNDLGPIEEFFRVLGRGYPRAAPGILTSLFSDPDTGLLEIEATADEPGGELVVWTPTTEATHRVVLDGLSNVTTIEVGDGRILTATVDATGAYSLRVEPVQ